MAPPERPRPKDMTHMVSQQLIPLVRPCAEQDNTDLEMWMKHNGTLNLNANKEVEKGKERENEGESSKKGKEKEQVQIKDKKKKKKKASNEAGSSR